MTYEEAIKCVNNVLNSDYHYDESLDYQLTSDDFEWLELAIKALEKQEPKKPIIRETEDYFGYMKYAICPNCRKVEFGFKQPCFCENCGQAIDWSVSE